MQITELDPAGAARLVPLNAVVHELHVAMRPDVFRAPPSEAAVAEHLAAVLARPGWFALLAGEAGEDLGYALCELQRVEGDALTCPRVRGFLHHIAVVGGARRRGVASALIAAAKARFAAEGATVWATTYWAWNEASAALMAKAGLRPAIVLADAPLEPAGGGAAAAGPVRPAG